MKVYNSTFCKYCKVASLSWWLCESAFSLSEADKLLGNFWLLVLTPDPSFWPSCMTADCHVPVCTCLLIWLSTRANWPLHFPGHNETGQGEFSLHSQYWSLPCRLQNLLAENCKPLMVAWPYLHLPGFPLKTPWLFPQQVFFDIETFLQLLSI